ncbi:hypothetical protein IHQ71_27875 [Rhizobium sp. TH2]|uniref:hypothetical protein n=1 Tax=Rhizobium sp. TH2 TaxID=2775403 RepID=UPI002157845E|nr:hypothetical protein [Rhizobium sp. TH2]UVC08888.1 hypothetical protein IHQ71_27875 [Rhizobium sp. TH2]
MFENFVGILADTRVGSTALGTGLQIGASAEFLGEILYPEVSTSHRHLYRTVRDLTYSDVLSDGKIVLDALDGFFSDPLWDSRTHYIFDIKYHDLGIVPTHPGAIGACPLLLEYLLARNFKIIHLNRRNKLAATLSQEVAVSTGLFHSNQGEISNAEVYLDIDRLIADVTGRERAYDQVSAWLRGHGNVVEVQYEALFLDEHRIDLGQILQRQFGLKASFLPRLKRLSSVSNVRVKNADEIKSGLSAVTEAKHVAAALEPYAREGAQTPSSEGAKRPIFITGAPNTVEEIVQAYRSAEDVNALCFTSSIPLTRLSDADVKKHQMLIGNAGLHFARRLGEHCLTAVMLRDPTQRTLEAYRNLVRDGETELALIDFLQNRHMQWACDNAMSWMLVHDASVTARRDRPYRDWTDVQLEEQALSALHQVNLIGFAHEGMEFLTRIGELTGLMIPSVSSLSAVNSSASDHEIELIRRLNRVDQRVYEEAIKMKDEIWNRTRNMVATHRPTNQFARSPDALAS